MIRKNISLEKDDLKKIEPIVIKNRGNVSAAIREIINFTDYVTNNIGDIESIKKFYKSTKGVTIPKGILRWFLIQTEGCLPDFEVIDSITETCTMTKRTDLSCSLECISDLCNELSVKYSFEPDKKSDPNYINIDLHGEKLETECTAKIVSCILGEKGYILSGVSKHTSFISLKLSKGGIYEDIREELLKHFGDRHVILQEILDKPVFWNNVITSIIDWSVIQKHKFPMIHNQKKF